MRKSKRVRQRRAKPVLPVQSEESIVPEQPAELVVPIADLSEPSISEVDEVVNVPMATPYIPWYVEGRSKPGEVVRVKDDRGQVQVVIIPEGGLQ